MPDIDYGPLQQLIGTWKGGGGLDVAPEPDGEERNPYYETIVFEAAGNVTNAESQDLAFVHYRELVQRESNDEVFHDQTGYWIWDKDAGLVMHSFVIPRAVAVIAGGRFEDSPDASGPVVLNVRAAVDDADWQIIQSPFMARKAKTLEFKQTITIDNGTLAYSETTVVDIYGKIVEHTDDNELNIVPHPGPNRSTA